MDSECGQALSNKQSEEINKGYFLGTRRWKNVLLIAIIAIVSVAVALLLLPYYLRDKSSTEFTYPLSCYSTLYTGSVCLEELQEWQSCLPERENVTNNVFIPSAVNQELSETRAETLFAGLQLTGPSQECEREFKSFWCLLLFGVCDSSGGRRLPSSDQCSHLQTDTCSELMKFVADIPEYSTIIQNCNNFRFNTPPCENESQSEMGSFNVSYSDGFYYDESSLVCKPKCGVWTPLSPEADRAILAITIIGDVIGITICSAVLILSIVKYKRVFKFPSVLMIYPTLVILIVSLFDLAVQLSPPSVLCASDDYIENVTPGGHSTALCKVQAVLYLTCGHFISLFWLFQTTMYFWMVIKPICYRSVSALKLKLVHVTVTVISFVLPITLVLLQLNAFEDKFGMNIFHRRKCQYLDGDFIIYSTIVPTCVIGIFGVTQLIIILWTVGNAYNRLKKKQMQKWPKLKPTEVKLIIITLYYLFLGVYSILSSVVLIANAAHHQRGLLNLLTCEALGDETMKCSISTPQHLLKDSFVLTFLYVLLNVYPSGYLVTLIPCRMCRKKTT